MSNKFRFALMAGIPAAGAFLLLSACGGGSAASSSTKVASKGQAVTVHYTVVAPDDPAAKTGPDGKTHDTFATKDSTTVHVGDTVTISVLNYDDVAHGMVFDTLGISKVIAPAKSDTEPGLTTFTFKATKAGTYRWYCPVPCDTDNGMWAMQTTAAGNDQDGFMAGTITVA